MTEVDWTQTLSLEGEKKTFIPYLLLKCDPKPPTLHSRVSPLPPPLHPPTKRDKTPEPPKQLLLNQGEVLERYKANESKLKTDCPHIKPPHIVNTCAYIEAHYQEWEGKSESQWETDLVTGEQFLKIPRTGLGKNELPFSLYYYKGGKKIFILFNHLRARDGFPAEKMIGSGGYKIVKSSYELNSGERFVEAISRNYDAGGERPDTIPSAREELAFLRRADGAGILSPVGGRSYKGKKPFQKMEVQKYSIRFPRCDQTLFSALHNGSPWNPVKNQKEKLFIFRHIVKLTDDLHNKGILHRDLKPKNILLVGNRPFLIDLGMATLFQGKKLDGKTDPFFLAGTTGYVAPEIQSAAQALEKKSDSPSLQRHYYERWTAKCDAFSLGRILGDILFPNKTPSPHSFQADRRTHQIKPPHPEHIMSYVNLYHAMTWENPRYRYSLPQALLALEALFKTDLPDF